MKKYINQYPYLFVCLWACILFIPFLGSVHLFDWDEINFSESAREMLLTGNYRKVQINFSPFTEKPPLFFWLQAMSMHVFGVTEFAARFPNAIIGLFTLLFVFSVGKRWFSQDFAWLWVILTTGSLTPHLYFKSGIIDPLYNLFIISSIYQLFLYTLEKKPLHAWLLGLFLGLAIITKGPVAVVIVVLCFLVYWAFQRFKVFFMLKHLAYAFLSAFFVSALWFGLETIENGPSFLIEFIKYQADLFLNPVAGHGQPFWYHPVVLLLGCFPASIVALPYLFSRSVQAEKTAQTQLLFFMRLCFWVVLILFSIVETKIVHYSSLCYIPLTFIAAHFLYQLSLKKHTWKSYQSFMFLLVGSLLSCLLMLLTFIDKIKATLIPYIKDEFAVASLQVNGGWQGWEFMLGLSLLLMMVYTMRQFLKQDAVDALRKFLLFNSVLILCLLAVLAPRIEQYSQAPAIEFFESLQDKDVYIETIGYKSYAQYFYGRTKVPAHDKAQKLDWLLQGEIDKEAYFSLHVNNTKDHINPSLQFIGSKGGFVFYKRLVQPDSLESIIKP
jgi:4-amino-4-deoxy-L-arabinose transferase-like glycosyltransferase